MSLAVGEVDITGCKGSLWNVGAYVEIIVFDNDGPEGYFERHYFQSSWAAATWFVASFNRDYNCRITQVSPDQ